MRQVFYLLMLSIGLLCARTGMAALNIEITKGAKAPIPLAVVPFEDQANVPVPSQSGQDMQITDVIRDDLQHSGYFNVTPFDALQQWPHTADTVNQTYWQTQGVDNVLVGQVRMNDANQVDVAFSLINVFQGEQLSTRVLLRKTITTDKQNMRQLAHRISDQIYAVLTGEKGIFSTKMAYVLVDRQLDERVNYTLELTDFDGANAKTLLKSTQPIMSPAWSPDGRQLAYVSFEHKVSEIYIHDIASGKRTLVSRDEGINGAPSWSPDGGQLVLVLSKTGHPKIYTLNLRTHALHQVTQGWSIDTEPVWAPDGKSLYFTSDRGGAPQIYQVDLSGNQIQRITFDGRFNARASLSANGQNMALLHRDDGGFNVAIYDLASGQMMPLTTTGHNQSPTLAPNGYLVMYETYFAGRSVLAIVSTDQRVNLRLPAREGQVQEPAWSPFLN